MIITDSLIRILSLLYKQKDKEIYSSIIAKNTNKTSSHVIKIINDLHNNGLIKREKIGRVVYLKLKDKGLKIGENCNNLVNSFK